MYWLHVTQDPPPHHKIKALKYIKLFYSILKQKQNSYWVTCSDNRMTWFSYGLYFNYSPLSLRFQGSLCLVNSFTWYIDVLVWFLSSHRSCQVTLSLLAQAKMVSSLLDKNRWKTQVLPHPAIDQKKPRLLQG